jgi:hypothetical protein
MGDMTDAYQEAIQNGNEDAYDALAGALYELNMGKPREEVVANTKRLMRVVITMATQSVLLVAEAEVQRIKQELDEVRARHEEQRGERPEVR